MRSPALFFVAALFNFAVAAAFVWPDSPIWHWLGLIKPMQSLITDLLAMFIALFGVAYFMVALNPRINRPLILLSALGKLAVVGIVALHYLNGRVGIAVPALVAGDLIFALLFLRAYLR